MDLQSLLSNNQKGGNTSQTEDSDTSTHVRPPAHPVKRVSSINLLVNNDDDNSNDSSNSSVLKSSSPVQTQLTMASPVLPARTISSQRTPRLNSSTIKERSSITSLTNDTDVDIDGKETPSIARRMSHDSESNSPLLTKKTLPKAAAMTAVAPSATASKKPSATTKPSKPKRYSKPPIWASKWRTSRTREFSGNGDVDSNTSRCRSINDVKPYNDLTRRISNWLYSHISSVPPEQRRFLELEVRFGQIWDKRTDRRIHLPVVNECILDKDYAVNDCHFKSGLEEGSFQQISKILTDLVKRGPKNFKTMITDQVDKQFRETAKNEIPRNVRISYDRKTNRVIENIEKKKIDSLFVHTGDLKFDYRLSIALEIVSNENPVRFENKTPEIERHKQRTSIIHEKTSTRFDLTKVKQTSKIRRSTQMENTDQLEVELEIDMPRLIAAFDNLSKDSFTFEDMSETLMDNARVLNRKLE